MTFKRPCITRHRTKFLWLPKTIQGETRWWQTATWREDKHSLDWFDRLFLAWTPLEWLS